MSLPDIDNIPDTGAVFTIGRSRFADNVASHFFIRRDPVVTVTCGDEHSAVVCQSGRLFVFGSNGWGQLGLGHKNHINKPSCVKILKPEKVTHVACGRAHTLICTGGQKIFACGSDQEGQLGRGSLAAGDSSSSPVLIYDCGLAGPKIVQIAAGSHHSMILTSDGGVLAWGSNLEGQLGLSGVSGLVNKPTKVQIPEPVKQISAGYYHSVFLTESGIIYVCGESESGKLGIVVNFSTQVAPKQLQLPITAVDVACGGHHTLVLADNGNLYCFGSNVSGQLGMGTNVTEVQTPKLLPRGALQAESISKIACGESHTAIVTESGKLFTCGDGRHGKLCLEENENNVDELTLAARYQELIVTNVSCGGCHTILVGKRREVNNEKIESTQMDPIIQRKNSLPPLKVPLNRLQNETFAERIELENEKGSVEAIVAEMPENAKNIEDRTTVVDKPATPKKMSDYYMTESSKMIEEAKREIANEEESKNIDKILNEMPDVQENNLEKIERKGSVLSVKSSSSDKSKELIEGRHSSSHRDEIETNSLKTVSSGFPMPPPKPPRQKVGITNGSHEEQIVSSVEDRLSLTEIPKASIEIAKGHSPKSGISSVKKFAVTNVEEKLVETLIREFDEVSKDEDKSMGRDGSESAKKLANSQKILSKNSKTEAEEIVEADRQKDVENVGEREKAFSEVKAKMEPSPDDSDVVPSSIPKTGKMARLFKSRKQPELENGTRGSGIPNAKLKSKTCTVL